VQDNQAAKEGDVLFEIDPEDYRLILEKAKAELALWIDSSHKLRTPCTAWNHSCPWLYDRRRCRQSRTAVTTLQAQREGAIATINLEELHFPTARSSHFFPDGSSTSTFGGCHVSAGVPVFSLLDTGKWYVIANFREAEVRHMVRAARQSFISRPRLTNASVEKCRESDGSEARRRNRSASFWCALRETRTKLGRVAQRFPVRIEVENPDPDLFRMARPRLRSSKVAAEIIYERDVCRSATDRFRWLGWLKRELAPTSARNIRTAIIVAGAFCASSFR